ncbi:MAG: DciA family protein [Jiangellaceae bacterium]
MSPDDSMSHEDLGPSDPAAPADTLGSSKSISASPQEPEYGSAAMGTVPPRPDADLGESSPPAATPAEGWDPEGAELAAAFLDRARVGGRRRGASGPSTSGPGRRSSQGRRAPGAGWSGPAGDDRDPQPLASAVDRLVGEHGWGHDLAVHGAVARWDQVVGPDVAAHVRPERYAGGELTVRADSTAWATQVKLLAPDLVRRLNEEIGDGTVMRVTVLGPHAPSWRRGPRSIPGRGPRDTYG